MGVGGEIMKTNEVEKLLGISKQTLFYYEKEGLLEVPRDENGYRNYSDTNISVLQSIKYLRSLDIAIDDVGLILNGDVSFQDILSLKTDEIEGNIEKSQSLLSDVETLREKQSPYLTNIKDLESDTKRYPFSYWKTTDTATIGRRVTRGIIFRWMTSFFFISITLTVSASIGLAKVANYNLTGTQFVLITIAVIVCLYIGLILDVIPLGTPVGSYRLRFVEFNEIGVNYYQGKGFKSNLEYILSVIRGMDKVTSKQYSDIQSVKINTVTRYYRPYAYRSYVPAMQVKVPDFLFEFKDGTSFYLYAPMILNNDLEWLVALLKEKVENLVDPDDFIEKDKN